nr:MAG TPA: hypothetical protein [Caudoviricetes sp.]
MPRLCVWYYLSVRYSFSKLLISRCKGKQAFTVDHSRLHLLISDNNRYYSGCKISRNK